MTASEPWLLDVENVEEPVTPADAKMIVDTLLADPRFKSVVFSASQDAIADKMSGYDKTGRVPNLLIIKQREALKVQPPHGG